MIVATEHELLWMYCVGRCLAVFIISVLGFRILYIHLQVLKFDWFNLNLHSIIIQNQLFPQWFDMDIFCYRMDCFELYILRAPNMYSPRMISWTPRFPCGKTTFCWGACRQSLERLQWLWQQIWCGDFTTWESAGAPPTVPPPPNK